MGTERDEEQVEEGAIQDTGQEWDEVREVEGMPPAPGDADPSGEEGEF
jgi:hypothetical protein